MTRDDIVRMAQEAAIMPPGWGATESQWRSLHAFADLVTAAENEACAKVCDARYMGDNNREDMEARRCAEAIRARNNK